MKPITGALTVIVYLSFFILLGVWPASVFADKPTNSSEVNEATSSEPSSSETTTAAPYDPCAPSPCQNGGNCSSSDEINYNCSCANGWLGNNCSEVDFCFSNPCSNDGTCAIVSNTEYNCTCAVDWTGINCTEEVNPCLNNQCQNGGDCTRLNATAFNCTCRDGYNGTYCAFELDPCESSPCLNDATCEKINGTHYNCQCPLGFNGTYCEAELDPCVSGPCLNGGSCSKMNGTHFNCTCLVGFAGEACELDIDDCELTPCQNGGSCEDGVNNYTCACTPQWIGTNCTIDIDECAEHTHRCSEFANCSNSEGNYTCACQTGYEGDGFSCTYKSSCKPDPCDNGGVCFSQSHEKYSCICGVGWHGANCSEDIDECSSNTSRCDTAWGVCNNTAGSYTCHCAEGSLGDGYSCAESMLYPHRSAAAAIKEDDTCVHSHALGGIVISGNIYHDIHVCANGYVTVGESYDSPNPPQDGAFPGGFPLLAPYWTDIDPSGEGGSVFIDTYDLLSANDSIRQEIVALVGSHARMYGGIDDFAPTYTLVATWDKVAPYSSEKTAGTENVTFQAVVASDSHQSIVLYNYEASRMLWSADSLGRRLLVGFTDGFEETHMFGSMMDMMSWNTSNIDVAGRMFFNSSRVENNNVPCLEWYFDDVNQTAGGEKPASDLGCPCTEHHAIRDTQLNRNDTYATDNLTCYTYRFGQGAEAATPVCCYDSHKALVLGEGGSFVLTPEEEPARRGYYLCCHAATLCHLYYQRRAIDSCENYKPPTPAIIWGDPHLFTFDGAEFSFNGLGEYMLLSVPEMLFELQGRLVLAEHVNPGASSNATVLDTIVAKANNTDAVQVQRHKAPGGTRYEDVVIRINGAEVAKQSDLNPGGTLYGEGVQVQKVENVLGTGDLLFPSGLMVIQFNGGVGLKVMIAQELLSVQVLLSSEHKKTGSTSGLLGTFDGDLVRDYTYSSGEFAEIGSSEETIFDFAQSWTVSENQSIFTNEGAQSYADFVDKNFKPIFYGDLLSNISGNFPTANVTILESICGEDFQEKYRQCAIDFLATGSDNIAVTTRKIREQFLQDRKTLELSDYLALEKMPKMLTVTGNTTYEVDIFATFYSSLDTSSKQEITIQDYNGSPFSAKIYVLDEKTNFEYLYWPRLLYSKCGENGKVDTSFGTEYTYSSERFYVAKCSCNIGFQGGTCMDAKNECQPNKCYTNCTLDTGTTRGYTCDQCPDGMQGNGDKCYEVNECLSMKPCSQHCSNIHGGFVCSCTPGYQLDKDNKTCIDVNECAGNHICTRNGQYCYNTEGTYECRCKANYFIQNGTCRDAPRRFGGKVKFLAIDVQNNSPVFWGTDMANTRSDSFKLVASVIEDTINVPFRDNFKENYIGSKVYKLEKGSIVGDFDLIFTDDAKVNDTLLNGTLKSYLEGQGCVTVGPDCKVGPLVGVSLTDSGAGEKDLCASPTDNDCQGSSTGCSSAGGKYACSCRTGYRPLLDYTTICQDIDECSEELHNCIANQSTCENLQGSFKCNCLPGYVDKDGVCSDICDSNPCKNGGSCSRTDVGFSCKCAGIWTGPNCEEENEEAKRYRLIAIIVGVVVGLLCLLLLIGLIVTCCRSPHRKNGGYYTGSDTAADSWESSTLQQEGRMRSSDYEMTENGSKQNLLVGGAGRTGEVNNAMSVDESGPAGNAASSVDYSNVNTDGKAPGSTSQGMQNPAYSDNLNN